MILEGYVHMRRLSLVGASQAHSELMYLPLALNTLSDLFQTCRTSAVADTAWSHLLTTLCISATSNAARFPLRRIIATHLCTTRATL